jgi:hypothetical protein
MTHRLHTTAADQWFEHFTEHRIRRSRARHADHEQSLRADEGYPGQLATASRGPRRFGHARIYRQLPLTSVRGAAQELRVLLQEVNDRIATAPKIRCATPASFTAS